MDSPSLSYRISLLKKKVEFYSNLAFNKAKNKVKRLDNYMMTGLVNTMAEKAKMIVVGEV